MRFKKKTKRIGDGGQEKTREGEERENALAKWEKKG